MKLTLVAVAVIVLVVVAAGCGGGKKKTSSSTTTAAASTTTTSAGSTKPATAAAGTTTAAAPSFASTKNCQQLVALAAKVSAAVQASSGNGTSSITTEADALKALASAAPSEIRGDFATFAAAFSAYAQALQKSGYTPGKTPTAAQIAAISTAAKSFSSAKLQTAEQHLSAWSKKNCGGLRPTTTG